MKILIIGGNRFFGKRLVHKLLNDGHALTLLNRGKTADDFGSRVKRLKADRTKESELKSQITEDYDVVVDNMCMTAAEAQSAINIFKDRIGHYVMTSTLSVYEQEGHLFETDFDAASYVASREVNYAEGKRAAEHAFVTKAPFPLARMRIPIVLGEDDYTRRLHMHIEHIAQGKALSFPNMVAEFSYIHADDAASALQWMVNTKKNDVYNISAEDNWSILELMNQIEVVVGKEALITKDGTPSPFGIEQDYYMNVEKAAQAGFKAKNLTEWMPDLIKKLHK